MLVSWAWRLEVGNPGVGLAALPLETRAPGGSWRPVVSRGIPWLVPTSTSASPVTWPLGLGVSSPYKDSSRMAIGPPRGLSQVTCLHFQIGSRPQALGSGARDIFGDSHVKA